MKIASQNSAIVAPSPAAAPFTLAMIGFSRSRSEKTISFASATIVSNKAGLSMASCIQGMSPPAENARPAPVSTTTSLSGSRWAKRKTSARSWCMRVLTAFI